jgi:ABC-type Fe3+-siderophore transport system permease subunit
VSVAAARSSARLGAIWLASGAVLAGVLLAGFRLGFAGDVETLLRANGVRAAFAAGAGALLAQAGALRQLGPGERPLRELAQLGAVAGAAGGGFAAAQLAAGGAALLLFALGAALGGFAGWRAALAFERPRRGANLGVLVVLGAAIAVAALAGTYARARRDAVAPLVAWLLGDLSRAGGAAAAVLLAAAAFGVWLGARALARGRAAEAAWLAFGLGVGAAGPLVFVGSFVPRTVRWLAPAARPAALLAASAVAGGATVAAIDAVPRLLVGGYDFPFAVPAALLAIPLFVGWNRARLRREAGAKSAVFEALEIGAIALATLAGAALAAQLAAVIRVAT